MIGQARYIEAIRVTPNTHAVNLPTPKQFPGIERSNSIYWGHRRGIQRSTLGGRSVEDLINEDATALLQIQQLDIQDIAYDPSGNYIYFVSDLTVYRVDSQFTLLERMRYNNAINVDLDIANGVFYVNTGTTISKIAINDLDDIEEIVNDDDITCFALGPNGILYAAGGEIKEDGSTSSLYSSTGEITAVLYDFLNSELYWSDDSGLHVGGDLLLENAARDIQIDSFRNNLYYLSGAEIRTATTDGENDHTVLTLFPTPLCLALNGSSNIQNKLALDYTSTTRDITVVDYDIRRELVDPSDYTTVRQLAAYVGASPLADYRVFLRDFTTKELTEIVSSAAITQQDSVVFIHTGAIDTPSVFVSGCNPVAPSLTMIKNRLAAAEILPARVV